MIDLHTHILYGIDDGSRSREMTVQMLQLAWQDGIRTMVATPHYVVGASYYTPKALTARFNDVLRLIKQANLGIKLLLGNELFFDEYIFEAVEGKACNTLAGTRYVLLELPMASVPHYTEGLLHQFVAKGYKPIIAHPERNAVILSNPFKLKELLEIGCLAQLNSTSICGLHGSKIQEASKLLLKSNMGHLVASDCHSDRRRAPVLSAAYRQTVAWVGKKKADEVFMHNPQTVLEDGIIDPGKLKPYKERGFTDRIRECFTVAK